MRAGQREQHESDSHEQRACGGRLDEDAAEPRRARDGGFAVVEDDFLGLAHWRSTD